MYLGTPLSGLRVRNARSPPPAAVKLKPTARKAKDGRRGARRRKRHVWRLETQRQRLAACLMSTQDENTFWGVFPPKVDGIQPLKGIGHPPIKIHQGSINLNNYNCNDLTQPHPKWWFRFMWGMAPPSPYFRLVKYGNSPRLIRGWHSLAVSGGAPEVLAIKALIQPLAQQHGAGGLGRLDLLQAPEAREMRSRDVGPHEASGLRNMTPPSNTWRTLGTFWSLQENGANQDPSQVPCLLE